MPVSTRHPRAQAFFDRRAQALASQGSLKERALIDALATRFASDGAAPRAPLDRAYADAMTKVAGAFPDDADVQTLYADAVMNTMAWDYWQKDGTLKREAEPIRRALERVVAAHQDHAGAHHYYIHLMEGSSTPEVVEASADRLGGLMPAAGHMVHMPAHIYLRIGRYGDAAEAHVRAIAADEDYLAQCQAPGLYPVSYYPHNLHFLWAAATLEGRGAVAIDAARQVAAKVPHVDEARQVRMRFDKAWRRADVSLTSSRVMPQMVSVTGPDLTSQVKEGPMEKFVSLSTGVRMEYVEQGRPDGIPVVFLHGVTDSWHSFEGVLPHLPPTVRAFAVSQRGHGDSGRPETGYRYTELASDVRAFMDAVGVTRAIIVGHSMGASVAQRFVIDHPDRVLGLVLMGAFASLYQDSGIRDFYASAIAPLADPIPAAFAREWQESTLARPIPPHVLDTVVSETMKVPARLWRELFTGFLKTPDFTSDLSRVSVPTLIVWGDRDIYAARAAQDRLLAVIPGARLVTYEGAGHGFHWEDPAQFSKDLLTFVLTLTTAGRTVQP